MTFTHRRPLAIAISLLIVGAVVHGVTNGWLLESYEWLWQNTTGRPYTHIMRDHGWMLLVPSIGLLAALTTWMPYRRWARVVLIDAVLAVGVVLGHVFW